MCLSSHPELGPKRVTRIIASLCIAAMAVGLIDGIDLTPPPLGTLTVGHATLIVQAIVLALVACVLLDIKRNISGTILCLILFTASYRTLFETSDTVSFWRDLTLITALLWTARSGKSLDDSELVGESDLALQAPVPTAPQKPARKPRVTITRFREDLNFADMN